MKKRILISAFLFLCISCVKKQKPQENLVIEENFSDTIFTKKSKLIFKNGDLLEIHKVDEEKNTFEIMEFDKNSSAFKVKSLMSEYGKHGKYYLNHEWIVIGSRDQISNNLYAQYLIDSIKVNSQENKITYKFALVTDHKFDGYILTVIFKNKIIFSKWYSELNTFNEVDLPYLENGRISINLTKISIDSSDKINLTASTPSINHDFSIKKRNNKILFSKLLPQEYSPTLELEIQKEVDKYLLKYFFNKHAIE